MNMSNLHALKTFVNTPVNSQMIQSLVNHTLKVLPNCAQDLLPSPPASPSAKPRLPSLYTFISRLVKYTNVFTGTLMATLVYLKKLHEKLPHGATAQDPSSRHRIFLACLILSAKFHNDASPKNKHWARYTDGLFQTCEINEMERQLLFLLDWDITVSNHDLFCVLKDFLAPIKQDIKKVCKFNSFLSQQNKPPLQMSASKSLPSITPPRSNPAVDSAPSKLALQYQLRKYPSVPQLASQLASLPPLPALPHRKPASYTSVQHVRSFNNANTPTIFHKSHSNLQSLHDSILSSSSSAAPASLSHSSSLCSVSSSTYSEPGLSNSSSCSSSLAGSPEDDFFLQSTPFSLPQLTPSPLQYAKNSACPNAISRKPSKLNFGFPVISEHSRSNYV